MKRPSFNTAKAQYQHRFTMEHVPQWANTPHNGKYYAPQYRTDKEWYEKTLFPGEPGSLFDDACYSTGQSWPLGQWLDKPYVKGAA